MPPLRQTLILTQRDIERLIDVKAAMRVIAEAFKAHARGEAAMPPKLYLQVRDGDFRAMPAWLARPSAAGLKWVNVHPHNRLKGLPTVMGVLLLNDPRTGFPLAVMDGLSITRIRTAAGGVAAFALARRNSRVAALIGCGAQAWPQLEALAARFRLAEVRVWGYRPGEAERFCRSYRRRLTARLVAVSSVEAGVTDADLIVTITPSRRPLVMGAWVAPGAHINAIGADAPGKQELDPALLREAVIFVDDPEQAIHGGEINVPIAQGLLSRAAIRGTVGEVLLGRAPGRTAPTQLTVFDSTGLALHDVALAAALYQRARRRHLGRALRLFT
ncbi:MAG: ornithine cyclodeaminase family protein [Candidatus Omnitrophica bacterium]|nr:ornithine cyclodeaminase family protein [Candidatus Omnitrophota bacterium]